MCVHVHACVRESLRAHACMAEWVFVCVYAFVSVFTGVCVSVECIRPYETAHMEAEI